MIAVNGIDVGAVGIVHRGAGIFIAEVGIELTAVIVALKLERPQVGHPQLTHL